MGDLKGDNRKFAAANSYINHMMKSPRAKKYSGELDQGTTELRKYIKLQGSVDIQKFKNEVKTKQMQAKIPKEMISQVPSPKGITSGLRSIDTSFDMKDVDESQIEIED